MPLTLDKSDKTKATTSASKAKKNSTKTKSTCNAPKNSSHNKIDKSDILRLTHTTPRIGVTDLQKDTRGWRRKLRQSGLIEITDRNSTAGYLMSAEAVQQLAHDFEEQERIIEEQAIQAMCNARLDVAEWESDSELAEHAKEIYKARFNSSTDNRL